MATIKGEYIERYNSARKTVGGIVGPYPYCDSITGEIEDDGDNDGGVYGIFTINFYDNKSVTIVVRIDIPVPLLCFGREDGADILVELTPDKVWARIALTAICDK